MLRLASSDGVRLASSRTLDATFGGGEANVAISLARLGLDAAFVTALPDNDLGDAARHFLAGHGVDVTGIRTRPGRLGIYFLEPGATQRPSRVLYDRAESSFMQSGPGDFAWESLLAGASWFHTTGITPALSASAAEAAIVGARAARAAGATVSVDLNYRAKLWKWGKPAGDVMADLVSRGGRPDRQRRGCRQGLRDPRRGHVRRRWPRGIRGVCRRRRTTGQAFPSTPRRSRSRSVGRSRRARTTGPACSGLRTPSSWREPGGSRRSSIGSGPATPSQRG